jgi:hypothetical protein
VPGAQRLSVSSHRAVCVEEGRHQTPPLVFGSDLPQAPLSAVPGARFAWEVSIGRQQHLGRTYQRGKRASKQATGYWMATPTLTSETFDHHSFHTHRSHEGRVWYRCRTLALHRHTCAFQPGSCHKPGVPFSCPGVSLGRQAAGERDQGSSCSG